MKKLTFWNELIIFVVVLQLISCSPRVITNTSNSVAYSEASQHILIFREEEHEPEGAIQLGTVRVDDSGFTTKCKFKHVIAIAMEEARKAGGDALKITNHTKPYMQMQGLGFVYYNCHEIDAIILKLPVATD